MGMEVPSAHIAETGVEELDARENAADIYHRDISWIKESDLVVAEISTPSHGVGYEIGYALVHQKPVYCMYAEGCVVSKMITGNPDPLLTISSYQNWQDAEIKLKDYLSILESSLEQRDAKSK
jgi:nucleoside 2-deoxyribosyltransferase